MHGSVVGPIVWLEQWVLLKKRIKNFNDWFTMFLGVGHQLLFVALYEEVEI